MTVQYALKDFISEHKSILQAELQKCFEHLDIPNVLKDSMLYSLEAGGKRLRPILLMASFKMFQNDIRPVINTALALEMVHTYSLIHDDLPAMDDDDYRRGKLTNHKAFDEATAILAGDALLTYSFKLIADDSMLMDTHKVQLIKELAEASGPEGMVGGQFLDLDAEEKQVTIQQLERIHHLKTGKLLSFAIKAGALIGQATPSDITHLEQFSFYLGLIFQIQDDILDIVGDANKMGKPVGSDKELEKSTYPNLLGLDGAKDIKHTYVKKAKIALDKAHGTGTTLEYIIDYISSRDH